MSESMAICAAFEEDLSGLLDGELEASRAAELRGHLAVCTACTERLGVLSAVDTVLRGAARAPVDAVRQERVRQRLVSRADAASIPLDESARPARRATPLRRRSATLALVASLAAGTAALVLLVERPEPSSQPAAISETELAPARENATADAVAAAEQKAAGQEARDAFAKSGASAPADPSKQDDSLLLASVTDEELELAAALVEMERGRASDASEAARSIRERVAALPPDEQSALLAKVPLLRAMPLAERNALRERWRRFREPPGDEQPARERSPAP